MAEELEAVKKELVVQIRMAEGAKQLMRHLEGDMLAASSEDKGELAEAGEATTAILRSAIATRRESTWDAAFIEAYDQAGDAASMLAASGEVSPASQSRVRSMKTRLAARKATSEGKQDNHVTL